MLPKPSYHEIEELLKKVNDIIWKMDLNLTLTYVSPAFERIIGFTPGERLSQSLESQMTPASYQKVIALFADELARDREPGVDPNRTMTIDLEYYHRDGNTLWFENVAGWDRAEDGTIVGVQGVSREITERKRAENILKESENKFRQIYNNILDVYYEASLDGIITEISPSIEKHSQYKQEDLIGKSLYEIYSNPGDRDKLIERLLENGNVKDYEISLTDKDDTPHICSLNVELIRDEMGNPAKIVGIFRDITENRQAEKENEKYTENLKAIFDSVPNVLALVDQGIRVEMINQKGAALVEKSKENLSGRLCGDVLLCKYSFQGRGCGKNPECSACPLRNRVLSTFETGKPHIEEEGQMAFLLNGKERTMDLLISTSLLDISGNKKVLLSFTDISERKEIQGQNRMCNQEIESIFRSAPIGIGVVSNRILTKINKRVEQISGYSEAELFGKSARILYPSDEEFEHVGQEKYRQIRRHGTGTVETRWKRKDGTIIDVLMSSTHLDLKDDSKGVTFTVLDITESKKDKAELLESERKYRTMMESLVDPTYICSADRQIEYMNPAMIKWLGLDATGRLCYEAIWGQKTECTWCPQNNRAMKDKAVTIEIGVPNSDQIYQITSTPIHHINGSISKFTSYRDITDIRKLQSRLQQAQKMESIGNLAGGIAHDFNNILFPIMGLAEMLTEDLPPGSPERVNAQEILHAGKRGADLVKQILAFSRQHEHKLIPTRVQQVMKEVLKLIRASIPTNIEINSHLQQDCGLVLADSIQLHQIGMNLITNAYHAVENINGKIDVEVREITIKDGLNDLALPPGNYAMLSVADNGVGIQKEHLDKIFDPYFTTKKQDKGTGLGLSVVYGIVKEHKGEIKVVSEPGTGTAFQVYLPLMKISEVAESISEPMAMETGTERILLVDDEAPIAKLVKHMLERLGYSVSIRTSSIEALEAFKAHPDAYNLVITDMSMPHMTGEQLAQKMLTVRPGMPIIICTGFSERLTGDTAKAMGIKGLLLKPVIKSAMAKEIRRVLDESGKQF